MKIINVTDIECRNILSEIRNNLYLNHGYINRSIPIKSASIIIKHRNDRTYILLIDSNKRYYWWSNISKLKKLLRGE